MGAQPSKITWSDFKFKLHHVPSKLLLRAELHFYSLSNVESSMTYHVGWMSDLTRACVQNAERSVWRGVNDLLMVVVVVLSPTPECREDQVSESGGLSAWGKRCPLPQLLLCEAGWAA